VIRFQPQGPSATGRAPRNPEHRTPARVQDRAPRLRLPHAVCGRPAWRWQGCPVWAWSGPSCQRRRV